MGRIDMHHRRVGPAGGALFWDHAGDGFATRHQQIDLEGPGAGGDHPFIGEVIDLDKGVMPVAPNQFTLLAQ